MHIERDRIRQVIERGEFSTVFQPVYSLARGTVSDLEALTRFTSSQLGPAPWFAAAHATGLGVELELATARRALEAADRLPSDVCLWVNLSPPAMSDPRAREMLIGDRTAAFGVEVTGQSPSPGDGQLPEACRRLQEGGVRIAVDDIAHGGDSRRRAQRLRPDRVKAGLAATRALETAWWQRRRARRMIVAAHRGGAEVVAEGVETPAQLRWWARLGADRVQGFLLAPPAPLTEALSSGPIGRTAEGGVRRPSPVP